MILLRTKLEIAAGALALAGAAFGATTWLQEHDEHYRNIAQLPEDIRARERYFFGNTCRGMAEYVAANT